VGSELIFLIYEVFILNIRTATLEDLQAVTAGGANCFPPAEAQRQKSNLKTA
jgi:hypothetical protein